MDFEALKVGFFEALDRENGSVAGAARVVGVNGTRRPPGLVRPVSVAVASPARVGIPAGRITSGCVIY